MVSQTVRELHCKSWLHNNSIQKITLLSSYLSVYPKPESSCPDLVPRDFMCTPTTPQWHCWRSKFDSVKVDIMRAQYDTITHTASRPCTGR